MTRTRAAGASSTGWNAHDSRSLETRSAVDRRPRRAAIGLALAGDMLVALVTAHIDHGFFVDEGGFELVLLLGGASVTIAFAFA